MNVHLFGKVDSPSIANWTIKKNCSRPIWLLWPNFYQNHRKRLLHGRFLVFISWDFSCSKVCLDIINILKRGGFRLIKFISDNRSILQALSTNNVSPKLTEINLSVNDIPIEQTLGILWNTGKDTFHIKYTVNKF